MGFLHIPIIHSFLFAKLSTERAKLQLSFISIGLFYTSISSDQKLDTNVVYSLEPLCINIAINKLHAMNPQKLAINHRK